MCSAGLELRSLLDIVRMFFAKYFKGLEAKPPFVGFPWGVRTLGARLKSNRACHLLNNVIYVPCPLPIIRLLRAGQYKAAQRENRRPTYISIAKSNSELAREMRKWFPKWLVKCFKRQRRRTTSRQIFSAGPARWIRHTRHYRDFLLVRQYFMFLSDFQKG